MKTRKLSVKKIMIFILILLIIFTGVFIVLRLKKPTKPINRVIDEVAGYKLEESKSKYYKSLFNEMKKILKDNEFDTEENAKIITKLFLTDFFTLNHALSKNDIGGVQYVYEDYKQDFIKNAKTTIYDTVESNIYGNRKQELPVVSKIEVLEITKEDLKYLDKTFKDSYVVKAEISYERDLGYLKNTTIKLVQNNEKLEIVEMNDK